MKNFALIGAAGYIAVRHMKAIKDTNNVLVAALDKNDSVGVIDSYFPDADFFTEFERFDRHVDKLSRNEKRIDYISICTPNYLHDSHIRFALKRGANAICEKPLVLNPWNIDALAEVERETGKKLYNILQLRLHRSILALKNKIEKDLYPLQNEISGELMTNIIQALRYRKDLVVPISKLKDENIQKTTGNLNSHELDTLENLLHKE